MFQVSSAWLEGNTQHQAVLVFSRILLFNALVNSARSTFPAAAQHSTQKPGGITSLNKNTGLINAAPSPACGQAKARFIKSLTASLRYTQKHEPVFHLTENMGYYLLATRHRFTSRLS